MSQIALPLDWPAGDAPEDYLVSEANKPLIRHFEHWSLWPVMATILTGPRKSGRSLLGRIFAAKAGGELIDNAENADEEAVFHAWNRAQEHRRPLILIANAPPPLPVGCVMEASCTASSRSQAARTVTVCRRPPESRIDFSRLPIFS